MTDDRIYEVEVAAPPQKVWEALTEPHTVRRYYYGTSPRTSWEVGSPIEFVDDDGEVQIEGVVLAFEPPVRLAHTFIATWYGGRDDQGSLHWEVAPSDVGSRVTLIHRGAHAATREGSETADGSQHVIQSLIEHSGYQASHIAFLLDAALGLINIEQNSTMKVFAVATVLLMPPTLVGAVYGMNFEHMPELKWLWGYPFALALMVASGLAPFLWFRRKGWF